MRLLATIIFIALVGCSEQVEQVPEYVYVPGNSVTETVTIAASQLNIVIDTPVTLHATRKTSGYKKVKYTSLKKDACWWRREPPAYEQEVSDNLLWIVSPTGAHRFNTNFRTDHTREVIFTRPGKYKLYAESALWCPPRTVSNTIELAVSTNGEVRH